MLTRVARHAVTAVAPMRRSAIAAAVAVAPRAPAAMIPARSVPARMSSSSVAATAPMLPRYPISPEDPDCESKVGYDSPDLTQDTLMRPEDLADDPTNRTFTYIVQGSAAVCYVSLARAAVHKFVSFLSASADVLALASLEVDISGIQEGMASTVKWRGKPVFIRHRTPKEIQAARADDAVSLRDPESDAERVQRPEWIVVVGVCTHLGCVPINAAGEWGGWFCPCHGSHYDTAGRIRKGPAPLNLLVPEYKFLSDTKVLLG